MTSLGIYNLSAVEMICLVYQAETSPEALSQQVVQEKTTRSFYSQCKTATAGFNVFLTGDTKMHYLTLITGRK